MLLRRLLALALLACCAVVATAAPSTAACPAGSRTLDQLTMRADAVFTGTVAARGREGRDVAYTVAVDRIYKGDTGEEAAVSTPRKAGACGLPDLAAGDELIWFATGEGDVYRTTADSGTAPATGRLVQRVEQLLGAGSSPTVPPPVEATFTPVADEATSLTRLAAPGVALVIVGLLGLVLVGSLGRRRS